MVVHEVVAFRGREQLVGKLVPLDDKPDGLLSLLLQIHDFLSFATDIRWHINDCFSFWYTSNSWFSTFTIWWRNTTSSTCSTVCTWCCNEFYR